MNDIKYSEENGFINIYLPEKINVITLIKRYMNSTMFNQIRHLKTSLIDEMNNEYYPGNYFIKKYENREYFILNSDKYIGICIDTVIADGFEEKSALYNIENGNLILRWNQNDKDRSTHITRRYESSADSYNPLSFSNDEIDGFVNRLIKECYECEGIEKVVNIDLLRDEILGKTSRIQS